MNGTISEEDLKDKLHFVRLAIFNARLLGAVNAEATSNPGGVFDQIVERVSVSQQDLFDGHIPLRPCLLNQSVPLSLGYLTFVWLREAIKKDGKLEAKVISCESMQSLPEDCRCEGERKLEGVGSYLRLIRNALSHGAVKLREKEMIFVFADRAPSEKDVTRISISWRDFEKYQDRYFRVIFDRAYPGLMP
ncbi:hypothetical protein [Halocynthiibacter styelae]|uniref:Uncharacterized protein n=1 Tax=Halocynthiibacter styelae TaxID=2761955 RepID=A0A8J7IPQ8_9RHOB|nr:hypothetical protein [Paenihalocynthiibacter styelae]MBI1492966.1 hypothetical protein [Paenihalocynthiibacter styelae]